MRQLLIGTVLGGAALLALAAAWPAGSATVATAEEIGATGSAEKWYTVLAGTQRAGHAYRKISRAFDTVILEEQFEAMLKDRLVRMESVVVYSTAKPIGPTEAKVATFQGKTKLMEGQVTFTKDAGGCTAHAEITGYMDKNGKVLDPPQKKVIDMPVPDGLVLMQPALVYLAPRLLPKEGKLEGIVYARFPEDVDFPNLVSFKPAFILDRAKADESGNAPIVLKILQKSSEGVKTVPFAKLVVDAKGDVAEYSWGRFVLKPSTREEATGGAVPPAK